MTRATYTVHLTFGETFQFSADLTEASAPILMVDEDGGTHPTPFQTADARHRESDAALLLLESFGAEYWLDPSVDRSSIEDEGEYIAGLIESIDAE